MRIGLHHGKCIGGLIGSKRIRYDIWGPDVLIGNIMEQRADVGRVLASDPLKQFYDDHRFRQPVCQALPTVEFIHKEDFLFQGSRIPCYHIDNGPDWNALHSRRSVTTLEPMISKRKRYHTSFSLNKNPERET